MKSSIIEQMVDKGFDGADINCMFIKYDIGFIWYIPEDPKMKKEFWKKEQAKRDAMQIEINFTNYKK